MVITIHQNQQRRIPPLARKNPKIAKIKALAQNLEKAKNEVSDAKSRQKKKENIRAPEQEYPRNKT